MINKIKHSKELIKWAIKKFPRIAVACSFGKDSITVLHLAKSIKPEIPVFTVMTPFKPKETFEYKDKMIKEWNLNIKEYISKEDPNGKNKDLHKTNPDECCKIFKVIPTKEAIKDLDCWITGLRKTEGITRKDFEEIELCGKNTIKLNPILIWTEADIWRYIATNNIPVHPWYGNGYRSLGCAPCSKPFTKEERGGRWTGTSKCGGECGIHTMHKK